MERPLNWWIRAFLVLSAIRGLILGVSGFVMPAAMPVPLDLTPLNARFVAALYAAGSIGLILTLFAPRRRDARPFLIGVGVVTAMLLATTLVHHSQFRIGPTPSFIGWIGSYIFDPIAVLLLLATNDLLRAPPTRRHDLSALFYVEAAALGALGLALLGAPATMAAVWPWKIAPFLAQLYSCFFIAFAVIALLVARDERPAPVRNAAASTLALMLLVLLASLLHLPRFVPGVASVLWFGGLLLGALAFTYALMLAQVDMTQRRGDAKNYLDTEALPGA